TGGMELSQPSGIIWGVSPGGLVRDWTARWSRPQDHSAPGVPTPGATPLRKKPRPRRAGARLLGVTGVTVTDRMLIDDAGLSRQHRDSRNSIRCDISAKTKSRTSFSPRAPWQRLPWRPLGSQRLSFPNYFYPMPVRQPS